MRTSEPIGEICGHDDNDTVIESKTKGRRGRAVRRVASVAMAAAVGLGVSVGIGTAESVERAGFGSSPGRGVVADIRGGMNLGNHNETLLTPSMRRRPRRKALVGGAAVVTGTAVLAAAPAASAVLGGMNLGNHNETLLVPRSAPRRRRRVAAAIVLAAGLGTSAAALADGAGADRDAVEVAIPGNYGKSIGGGSGG